MLHLSYAAIAIIWDLNPVEFKVSRNSFVESEQLKDQVKKIRAFNLKKANERKAKIRKGMDRSMDRQQSLILARRFFSSLASWSNR